MQPDFWHERWQSGQIGFHLAEPNPRLIAHWDATAGSARRVLVPLCGKSVDLAWLAARGHDVVGVELSELAAEAFFAERGIVPTITADGPFRVFRHERLAIAVGDFFAATPSALHGAFDAVYDRAAMIAMPPELRPSYVKTLVGLLAETANLLLVTLDFDAASGPPFCVDADEVRDTYGDGRVELLERADVSSESPNLLGRGATRADELVFRIRYPR